jgi:hypothetical protein
MTAARRLENVKNRPRSRSAASHHPGPRKVGTLAVEGVDPGLRGAAQQIHHRKTVYELGQCVSL